MILVQSSKSGLFWVYLIVIILTAPIAKGSITRRKAACPPHTKEFFFPTGSPTWFGCKSADGLYQGILIQYSNQGEIIRIAGVQNSLREGIEIRRGKPGELEERRFKGGHLNGKSSVFSYPSTLERALPEQIPKEFWSEFLSSKTESILRSLIKTEPKTELSYLNGRLKELKTATTQIKLTITADGRMLTESIKDLKGQFIFDPEALWLLSPADTKAALLPGFGSCKKYAGPIGRYQRHLDALYFKREIKEKKHLERESEIRDRFISFCLPAAFIEDAGILECPPALPSAIPPAQCKLAISDELHVPFQPKFFSFDFGFGQSPDRLRDWFMNKGILKFLSDPDLNESEITLSNKYKAKVKKTPRGTYFQLYELDSLGKWVLKKSEKDKTEDWWVWHRIPGL